METGIPDALAEVSEAISLPPAKRDHLAVDGACERMDRRRDELRKRLGEVRLTSDLIREVRDP